VQWLRRHYGAGPLHLAGLVACFAIAAYALAKVLGENGWKAIFALFAVCIIAHDLIVWPVYGLADRMALRFQNRTQHRTNDRARPVVPWINHVRVPVVISVLLAVMFFPLILRLSNPYYQAVTGFNENVYLINWLVVTGVLFAGSALAYLVRVAAARNRGRAASSGHTPR
jgi:hypothetical protein